MLKILMATTAITIAALASPVQAQTTAPRPLVTSPQPGQVDLQKLIGRSVTNAQNESVGDLESVIVDADGKVRAAIIGVGGFLGLGERHVAVEWSRLTVSQDGQKIIVDASKDELKALPPYAYADVKQRRTVFVDSPTSRAAPARTVENAMPISPSMPLSASDLMGLNIRNSANDTIGEIKDVSLSADGKIQNVIVGVGGFLGVGERYVALSWDQLRIARSENNALVAQVNTTKDQLMMMPILKRDKSVWVRG